MKWLSLAFLFAASAASAAPFDVTDAWFRSLPGKLPAAGYFTAQNNTRRDVAITGARADGCGMLMIHQSRSAGGVNSMDMLDKVTVPAGGQVSFAPTGYHLMCTEPKPVMKPGATVPVTLLFQGGGKVTASFIVRNAAGR